MLTKNHNVMIKKTYENPLSELIFVNFETGILVISGEGSASNGYNPNNPLGGLGDEDGE